jgi:hypothetical protein
MQHDNLAKSNGTSFASADLKAQAKTSARAINQKPNIQTSRRNG